MKKIEGMEVDMHYVPYFPDVAFYSNNLYQGVCTLVRVNINGIWYVVYCLVKYELSATNPDDNEIIKAKALEQLFEITAEKDSWVKNIWLIGDNGKYMYILDDLQISETERLSLLQDKIESQ